MNRNSSNQSVKSLQKCKQTLDVAIWREILPMCQKIEKLEFDKFFSYFPDEQDRVQKKTFVNWINSHLSRVRIRLTFTTGHKSGCQLVNTSFFGFFCSEIRPSKFMTLLRTWKVELSFWPYWKSSQVPNCKRNEDGFWNGLTFWVIATLPLNSSAPEK